MFKGGGVKKIDLPIKFYLKKVVFKLPKEK